MIIHLVGAQRSNYPWGFENRLISAIHELGHTLISTDFRQERANLPELFQQKADLVLVCKGEGIDSGLIESCPCATALWYAEQVGTPEQWDEMALARRQELGFNVQAFDSVFSHDPKNLLVYKSLSAKNVFALPCAAVDPALNRRLGLPKKHDVVFVGSKTERRQRLLESLVKRGIQVYSPDLWNAEELNRLFNESRIVLNLHLSDLLNTETRVAEVLGAGSFLLSETLSDPDLVENKKHFVEFTPGDTEELEDKINFYLHHEPEREEIAREGWKFMQENHTYARRIQKILDTVDFSVNRRIWPAYSLGVPLNRQGKPTLRLDRYNTLVRESLMETLHLSEEATAHPNECQAPSQRSCIPSPGAKKCRPLRIFAAFAHVNWEGQNLLPALKSFGDVYHFSWNFDEQYSPNWHRTGKSDMNRRMIETLVREHRKRPFDVFFGYLSGRTVFPGVIRAIGLMGIPTVNLSLDDKAKFAGRLEPTGHAGMIDIAGAFNLCATSTEDALDRYKAAGAKAVYLPAGANPDIFKPLAVSRDVDVSFIGQKYGQRPVMIEQLRKRGIDVKAFGKGWEAGELSVDAMVEVYSRSKITLGFAGVGDSEDVLCLKGRDFEVPMSGAFYLTQHHPELEAWFRIGKEIVCYRDVDDLIRKIHYYLSNPDEMEGIRKAARERSLRDHTWTNRFTLLFGELGVLKLEPTQCIPLSPASSQRPDKATEVLRKGEELYLEGELVGAMGCFEETLRQDPENIDAMNNIGVLLYHSGEFDKAVSQFSRALSIKSDYYESIENLGSCLETKGEYGEALNWFCRALQIGGEKNSLLKHIRNCRAQLSPGNGGDIPRRIQYKSKDTEEPEFQYSEEWYDTVYHQGRFDLSMGFEQIEQTRYAAYRNRCYSVLESIQDLILHHDGEKQNLKWLEVCCQLGMTAKWIKDKFPFVSMHMFDFSATATRWLGTNFPYEARIWKGTIEDIRGADSDYEEYFDFVSCIDVTEHLPQQVYIKAIEEMHRVLKRGGRLLLMQGDCRENPEHINVKQEKELIQDFIGRGFEYQRALPYRHHLLRKIPVTASVATDQKQDGRVSGYPEKESPNGPQHRKTDLGSDGTGREVLLLNLRRYMRSLERNGSPILRHPGFMRYVEDFEGYLRMPGAESRMAFWPCLGEGTLETNLDRYYFYQDTWAAGKVFQLEPTRLVDVGSTALLVGVLAQRFKTISIDIRPLPVSLPGLECRRGSITDLPFEKGTVECLTSLCVIEHVGLGRYGDPIDPYGSQKAFREIRRVMKEGGHLLVSVPLSHTSGVLFNAHRIFTKEEVLNHLQGFRLIDELYLFPEPGDANKVNTLKEMQYCVWCAHFVRKESPSHSNQHHNSKSKSRPTSGGPQYETIYKELRDKKFSFSEFLIKLYQAYSHELGDLTNIEKLRYNLTFFPTTGQYDLFESQTLYMLVRETAPENMIEFSSSSGYSTLFTAMAMQRNAKGTLHTFEIDPNAWEATTRNVEHFGFSNHAKCIQGDVTCCLEPYLKKLDPKPSMMFIDSDHSSSFAKWYLSYIIPLLPAGTLVHIHDILPPEHEARIIGSPAGHVKAELSGENKELFCFLDRLGYQNDIDYIYLHTLSHQDPVWVSKVQQHYPGFIPYRTGRDRVIRRMNHKGEYAEWNATLWIKIK